MATGDKTIEQLQTEVAELRFLLEEARETLGAIAAGEVDAVVVNTPPDGPRIFTLQGADRPYRVIVESMSEGAVTLAPDGTILYCNSRLAAMLNIPLASLPGTPFANYVTAADRKNLETVLEQCADGTGKLELKLLDHQGNVLPVLFSCRLLQGNEPPSLCAVVTDLSERKRIDEIIASEEERRQAHEKLEQKVAERTAELAKKVDELQEKEHILLQQSRMAAMGEMISNIAHQWRQPLNVLGLNIQRLPLFYRHGKLTPEFLDEAVEDAMRLIFHMSNTIDDFRNFFKPDKEKVSFRLSQVVENAVKLIEGSFKNRSIRLVIEHRDDPELYGYPNEYSQVLLNILNNAKDAIENSKIPDGCVKITTWSSDGRSIMTVCDNAGGIPQEVLFKVFDPHFTTKGAQGTGIGLFMAKNIIERNMGGRLSASNTAEGAEFRIEV